MFNKHCKTDSGWEGCVVSGGIQNQRDFMKLMTLNAKLQRKKTFPEERMMASCEYILHNCHGLNKTQMWTNV